MSTLILLRYNNYYNRIVKKEKTLEEYKKYQMGTDIQYVNFIPNDLINTTQIINWPFGPSEYGDPDYMIVSDSDNNIMSRWFIIDIKRTTSGQSKLELRRDLMVDFYDYILNAPCFIEKATIRNIDDPAIFNNEDMTFNQIKKAEYQIKDASNIAWIVGYIPRDSFPDGQSIKTNYTYKGTANETVASLQEYKYYKYSQFSNESFSSNASDFVYKINTFSQGPEGTLGYVYYDYTISMDNKGIFSGLSNIHQMSEAPAFNPTYTGERTYMHKLLLYTNKNTGDKYITDDRILFLKFIPPVMEEMNEYAKYYFTSIHDEVETAEFLKQNGRIIKNSEDGQFYRIRVNPGTKKTQRANIASGNLFNIFYNNINQEQFSGTPNSSTFEVCANVYDYKINIELLSSEINTTIENATNRYHLNDSPYDMFFMPFPSENQTVDIYKNGQIYIRNVDRLAALTIATNVASKLGSANIYDLQLLPYCPFQELIKDDGTIDIGSILCSDIKVVDYDESGQPTGNERKVSVLFWALSSQFSINVPFLIPKAETILDKKIKNETEFWRLCSPNYSGLFEFSAEKNNGVSFFRIDCTYKPFNPYIHVAIDFKNLYGNEYGDSRGLVCGGDYSLPQVTSAWAEYALNNKNYQQMFDREIQNMEVNNAAQKERELWNVAAGTFGAGVGGIASGMMIAGPYGALAGIPTAGLSLAGGIRDIQLNERLRNEAIDYKKDMFGYQMQNIKALPQGLAKVSAFTANNKIFPFIEKYGCTDIEEQALRAKLYYNGMTIMRIATISQFISPIEKSYIKGRIIRLDDLEDDYHIANEIAEELMKGVYL